MTKVIISGGGTGGHIFPAIAIADEIKKREENVEILFVGANGRMEMERVPKAGYRIIGLNIAGLQRRLTWKNILVPFKLIGSMLKARKVIKSFKPDVAVGVGGYASGPLVKMAASMGVPCLLQEQNSYPGITNKLLSKKAQKICVAYEGMERFFAKEKIVLTGNPVRAQFNEVESKKSQAIAHFGLEQGRLTVLIIGGSLGARSINLAIRCMMDDAEESGIQLIWQTGRRYHKEMHESVMKSTNRHVHCLQFIDRMDLAYSAADIIISRAGAISISELCLIGKPVILVPSPNVSEDHQTKNAMALVEKGAALIAKDVELNTSLWPILEKLIGSDEQRTELSQNIKKLARPDSTKQIVDQVMKLIR